MDLSGASPRSNRSLRFNFSDDVVYKSVSPREHQALGFGIFWWGFGFSGSLFLVIHTSHKILHTYITSIYQLEVGDGISILLIVYVGSYLPSSIPHPPETQPMLPLTLSPTTMPKSWAIKMS
jgi:hypothetical protein